MRRILILAYATSPFKGSEFAVGWNYVNSIAKSCIVDVIVGVSDEHLGDMDSLVNYLENNSVENVNFHMVSPPKIALLINKVNKLGFGPAFYIAFSLWHRKVYSYAKTLCRDIKFDVVHQLNPIGFREPGYLWRLNLPFVWGPIGGAVFVPDCLLKELTSWGKFKFKLKNFANYIQLRFYSRPRIAALRANSIMFANSENREHFEHFFGVTGPVISEQAISEFSVARSLAPGRRNSLRLIFIGSLDERKNLKFILECLSEVKQFDWSLDVVGDGVLRQGLKNLCLQLGLSERVNWHGKIARERVIDLLSDADLNLMASLAEGNPASLYESMSCQVPTLSLDKDGMRDSMRNIGGFLVKIECEYYQVKKSYVNFLKELLSNPARITEESERIVREINAYSWIENSLRIIQLYDNAIDRYNENKND